jgi:hypothetical protein
MLLIQRSVTHELRLSHKPEININDGKMSLDKETNTMQIWSAFEKLLN